MKAIDWHRNLNSPCETCGAHCPGWTLHRALTSDESAATSALRPPNDPVGYVVGFGMIEGPIGVLAALALVRDARIREASPIAVATRVDMRELADALFPELSEMLRDVKTKLLADFVDARIREAIVTLEKRMADVETALRQGMTLLSDARIRS